MCLIIPATTLFAKEEIPNTETLRSMVEADWAAQEHRKGRTPDAPEAICDSLQSAEKLLADLRTMAEAPNVNRESTELKRLNKLVTDFLQVSRPLHPEMRLIHVKPLLMQIIELLGSEAEKHQIRFDIEISPAELAIQGDEDMLKTACLNIVLNAIQAMENGGRLRIQARTSPNDQTENTRFCEIAFSDSGPGIPPEHRENIFQPYFTTKKEGTGLGLSIVNRVIEDHHGTIRIASEEGQGTTITLLLPMGEPRNGGEE